MQREHNTWLVHSVFSVYFTKAHLFPADQIPLNGLPLHTYLCWFSTVPHTLVILSGPPNETYLSFVHFTVSIDKPSTSPGACTLSISRDHHAAI